VRGRGRRRDGARAGGDRCAEQDQGRRTREARRQVQSVARLPVPSGARHEGAELSSCGCILTQPHLPLFTLFQELCVWSSEGEACTAHGEFGPGSNGGSALELGEVASGVLAGYKDVTALTDSLSVLMDMHGTLQVGRQGAHPHQVACPTLVLLARRLACWAPLCRNFGPDARA
jgi:hypothetical protein